MNEDTTTEINTSSEVSFQPRHRILSNKSMVHSDVSASDKRTKNKQHLF